MPYNSLEDALTFGFELERPYRCEAHDDHNASASVNSVSGLFFCYTCGHAGRVDPEKIEITNEGLSRHMTKTYRRLTEEHRYSESWLATFDGAGPGEYWLNRFSAETCRYYRLGSAPGVATYPMRDNAGRVLGIVSRDTTGERLQKYLYPQGVSTSDYLIDYHRVCSPVVVLVEGMADVAAVHEAGYPIALGCYRAGLSAAQVRLLAKYEPTRILVAYDQDKAGDAGFAKVHAALGREFKVERMWWDDAYKDVAEIPVGLRAQMLDALVGHGSITTLDRHKLSA